MSWGADVLGVTEETFSMIKSTTAGINTGTGLQGVDLQPLVSLVPVDTPFRNSNPRVPAPMGATNAYWETLLNVNSGQSNAAVQNDYAGPIANIDLQNVYAPFAVLAQGGTVTQDAIAQAQGYADALAVGTLQTLNQLLISDDINQLNAISFPLPAIATPATTASTTGGTIAGGTAVYVKVAPISGNNYYYGGSGPASAASALVTTSTTTSTGSVTATVAAVKCAAGYNWYVGTTSTNGTYYTTTAVNTVTITSGPFTTAQAPPTTLPLFTSATPSPTPPTADTSYESYWQTGLLGSILGDLGTSNYATPGTATSQGAYYKSVDGGTFTVSGAAVEELDNLNLALYSAYQLSPTRYLMPMGVITNLANAVLNNPQAVTWLVPTDADGRARVVAGGHVATYLNKTVGGKPIALELHPHLPPGKVIAVVDEVPFPGANIDTVLSVETQLDYWRFDYGASRVANVSGGGPRYDFEIRSKQAFRNKAGSVMGVLDNLNY